MHFCEFAAVVSLDSPRAGSAVPRKSGLNYKQKQKTERQIDKRQDKEERDREREGMRTVSSAFEDILANR